MVPPTGASDSILLVRRNGASIDPYYGALTPQLKNYSMESNDPTRSKSKNWGEKWKANKAVKPPIESQMIETSNFMVHPDYLNKYGTLSNGVITKSIKYAETWLYGTVGVRAAPSQRPSLFLYPGVVAPAPRIVNQNNYLTPPAAYVGIPTPGYSAPDPNGYVLPQPRKHSKQSEVYQCGDCRKDIRPGTSCKKCGEKRNGTGRSTSAKSRPSLKDTLRSKRTSVPSAPPDPYNLMRKSRLGGGEVTAPSIFSLELSHKKKRNASASPLRRPSRDFATSTFETFKPKQPENEEKPWKSIEGDWCNGEEEVVRRKSILECDVNAYELNKNRNKLKDDEDSCEEFGEGTKIKILRPKLTKTDLRKIGKPESEKSEALRKSEVRLNGQRFKIFDHSAPSTSVVEGYVSDDEEPKAAREPPPPSPKRPPRRPKDKVSGDIGFKYSKLKSKSSPNLSIKSILKKPTGGDDSSVLDLSFQWEEIPSAFADSPEKPSLQPGQSTKKQSQNTLKKKKQVQFRVNNSYESLNQTSPPSTDTAVSAESRGEDRVRGSGTVVPEETEIFEEPKQLSKSCENLVLIMNERVTGNEIKSEESECDERKDLVEEGQRVLHLEEDSPSQGSTLKRSYSDRRPSSALVLYKDDLCVSTSPPNSTLFNDTMALRTRTSRLDTREVFTEEKNIFEKTKVEEKILSEKTKAEEKSGTQTTSKPSGVIITYAEFSKLLEDSSSKKESANKSAPKKSKLPVSSVKTKPAPNPPPRQSPTKQTKIKTGGATTVKVSVQERKTEVVPSTTPEVKAVSRVDDGKTLVRLSAAQETPRPRSPVAEGKRASITIHLKNTVEQEKTQPKRKTSVLINNFHPQDSNKVTISVRNDPVDEEPNSSTCTIIETGSNSTVIPVMSTDNKTTLIVGSNTPVVTPTAVDDSTPIFPQPQEEAKPSQYIFSKVDKAVEFMDPVEAVKRNLIPHICGKEDNALSLMGKIKQSRETKEQKSLKQISQLFANSGEGEESSVVAQPSHFLLSSYRNKKGHWKTVPLTGKSEGDSSTTTSRSNSFCSTVNSSAKNSSTNTSRSSSFRSSCYKSLESDYEGSQDNKFYILSDNDDPTAQEKDKLEYEYEIRNGFKDEKKDDENIYETIKEEPIYDQIQLKDNDESEDDIPPPLPLTLPPSLDEVEKRSLKSIFEGASKYDILNYLVDAKERVQEESYFSGSSTSEDVDSKRLNSLEGSERASLVSGTPIPILPTPGAEKKDGRESGSVENDSGVDLSSAIGHESQTSYSSDDNLAIPVVPGRDSLKLARKSSAEIERNDSGVGSETSHTSRSKWQVSSSIREDPHHLCEDCDQTVETQVTDGGVMYAPLVCRKCSKRRSERKEIIQEIAETEEKYGRDLKIILEEFYKPMLVAGLLTPDQLSAIFLNTEELLENSEQLTEKLRDTLEIATEQGDEDLLTVNIGKIFLEAGPMLHAFESYCTRQGAAAVLLANLEKEKELLRIFLRVSQMENTVLRRMNLNSFLMVPVQRVTKYPLLLARLYKVTPPHQEPRELLKEAQHNIELHLEHMNSEAKDVSATKVWRRFSTSTVSGRKSTAELEMINIKLRKMAVDVLDWNHEEVRFVMEGKLLYTQPTDNNWKRGRTIKLTPIFVLLVTLGKPNSKYKMDPPEDELTFPTKTGVREATLLLVKEKCGRYTLIREPLYLDKIIVCCETDVDEYFEIQELSTKDSFIFKAEDGERTKEWYKHLQYHAQILGSWRRRRNALANIMINGMMARAYTS